MPPLATILDWETFADHLRVGLGYTDVTFQRTKYTYNIFIKQFCGTEGDAETRIEQGIEQIDNTFNSGCSQPSETAEYSGVRWAPSPAKLSPRSVLS